ncbi:MAG: DUF342 domain-containing protein [Desulfuromusa sp.]|nr:DUF342 domain-containing protein [Desulfuromusa sp.]
MSNTEETIDSQENIDPNLLFVEENSRYKLSFRLQNEQMECLAEIEIFPEEKPLENEASQPTTDEADSEIFDISEEKDEKLAVELAAVISDTEPTITPPDLLWFLQQNNIIQTIDYSAVYDFCAGLEMGLELEPTVLAKGIEPITGADGWFELTVKIFGEDTEFDEDEEGNIDLRTLHAYSEIEPEQKLGVVHPPQDGTSGIDVIGLPIPAERGKAFELIAGEGVILKFEDRVAFAEKSGRCLFEKQTISIVDQLVVTGDVDLNIGNIDFHGFVEVKGDVPDDFDIKTTKGMKVSGHIGACNIESDGTIEISSMAGKETGQITCHGDLHANFLNQVTVICYGDIYVTKEIRNSQIKSTGKIIVENGSIIGGECTSLEGIEAKNMGTNSGQKTRLIAGIYFPDAGRFDYLREQLQHINQQIKSINEALGPLKQHLKKDDAIAVSAEVRLTILNEQLDKLHEEKDHFTAEITASKPQKFNSENPKINILTKLMEGVSITLGDTTEKIKIERSGPLSIIENTRDGGLRYLTLSPMQVMAQQLEEDIFAESSESEPVPD